MRRFISFAIITAIFLPLNAETTSTLESALAAARQNNPELKSAEKTHLAADEGISSMGGWSSPWVGYEFMKDDNRLYLSQMFAFPGKLSNLKISASSSAQALEQEYKQAALELDTKVKKAFWGYWLAIKNIDAYKENIELMGRFLEASKSRYIVGKVTEADVLAANAELGRMRGMLVMGEYEADAMRSELNALMNKAPDDPLGVPQRPEMDEGGIDYTRLEQKTLNDNFKLASKKYAYQGSLADSKYSKLAWFPDLMAEARISEMSEKSAYMAAVQLPLYFWNRTSEVRSKTARAEAAAQNLESERNNVRLALKSMYLRYNRNLKLIKIYESDILPSARQAVQISESGYRTGKLSFQYLLDLQKKYLDFEVEYNKLTAESRMYYAELEMLAGGAIK